MIDYLYNKSSDFLYSSLILSTEHFGQSYQDTLASSAITGALAIGSAALAGYVASYTIGSGLLGLPEGADGPNEHNLHEREIAIIEPEPPAEELVGEENVGEPLPIWEARRAELEAIDFPYFPDEHSTPLYLAVLRGDTSAVQTLIENGANPNADYQVAIREGRSRPFTPLHVAVSRGNAEMIEALIHGGANINQVADVDNPRFNASEVTPLHIATQEGDLSVVQILIEQGASIEQRDEQGNTPIHAAVSYYRNLEAARCLAKEGADVNALNGNREKLLDVVIHRGHRAFAKELIRKYGAKISDRNGEIQAEYDAILKELQQESCHASGA